jgi:ribosomal protein L25 (general stress protein Ctc)
MTAATRHDNFRNSHEAWVFQQNGTMKAVERLREAITHGQDPETVLRTTELLAVVYTTHDRPDHVEIRREVWWRSSRAPGQHHLYSEVIARIELQYVPHLIGQLAYDILRETPEPTTDEGTKP